MDYEASPKNRYPGKCSTLENSIGYTEEFKKYDGQLPKGELLPVLSNQKLNSYLKEIADLCGINKNITFHLARHTFSTTVTLAKGVPIETVSKMLGHTNIETTQIYARITNDKIRNDMQQLSGKLDEFESIALNS